MALHTETKIYKHAYQLLNLSIEAKANTAQMVNSIGVALAQSGMQWLELDNVLTQKLGATHVDMGHLPDPSRLNTGGMH